MLGENLPFRMDLVCPQTRSRSCLSAAPVRRGGEPPSVAVTRGLGLGPRCDGLPGRLRARGTAPALSVTLCSVRTSQPPPRLPLPLHLLGGRSLGSQSQICRVHPRGAGGERAHSHPQTLSRLGMFRNAPWGRGVAGLPPPSPGPEVTGPEVTRGCRMC